MSYTLPSVSNTRYGVPNTRSVLHGWYNTLMGLDLIEKEFQYKTVMQPSLLHKMTFTSNFETFV